MATGNMERLAVRLPASLRERLESAAAASGHTVSGLARHLLDAAVQAPLTNADRATFGPAAKRHPVLGFLIEDGRGSLPVEQQAQNFINEVAKHYGPQAAAVLQRELAAAKEQT
jgi:CopG-like RHH_1 or ribbon-helix-helix domain, RHH_5